MVGSQLEQSLSILVHFSRAELSVAGEPRVVMCASCAHSGIEVARENDLFIIGDAANDDCDVLIELVFCIISDVADIVGAFTLTRVTGPAVLLSRRVRSRSEPLLPGPIMLSRLFLTATATPYSLSSPSPSHASIMCYISPSVPLNPQVGSPEGWQCSL